MIAKTIKAGFAVVMLLLVPLAGYGVYQHFAKPTPVGSDSVIAQPAPALRKAPTARVQVKAPVKVFRGETKANLKLPPLVQADPNQEVVAASQVKANLRPQTVSTVINTETGETQTFVKTDPYPLFAVEPRGEARLSYGYKWRPGDPGPKPVLRLQVTQDLARVKAFTLGLHATADSDSTVFVGAGVAYKW